MALNTTGLETTDTSIYLEMETFLEQTTFLSYKYSSSEGIKSSILHFHFLPSRKRLTQTSTKKRQLSVFSIEFGIRSFYSLRSNFNCKKGRTMATLMGSSPIAIRGLRSPAIAGRRGVRCSATFAGENYYKTLSLRPGATEKEVKKAFRKLALKYHPDVCRGNQCTVQFQQINQAYEMIYWMNGGDQCNKRSKYTIHTLPRRKYMNMMLMVLRSRQTTGWVAKPPMFFLVAGPNPFTFMRIRRE